MSKEKAFDEFIKANPKPQDIEKVIIKLSDKHNLKKIDLENYIDYRLFSEDMVDLLNESIEDIHMHKSALEDALDLIAQKD